MTRGSRIVDLYNTVQNVEQFYIALNGVVNSVAEGYVAEAGVIHQFWPPTLGPDNAIVLTTDTELSYATKKVGEGEVRALCTYDARTARLILSDQDEVKYINVLAPVPRGAGNYLLRVTEISGGLTLQFPSDEWHDVFELGNLGVFENYLLNGFAVQSVLEGVAEVSVAEDDGAGAPIAPTIVTKTINFKAEVVGDNLSFTTAPWVLTDIQVNTPASVTIYSVPSGFGLANEAFFVGNEHDEGVIREIYAVEWGPQFTIQVDVLAGAVTGATTGVQLSTDVRRQWDVLAPNPLDNNSATVDVTIGDGVNFVTKQVFMTATQNTDEGPPGSVPSDDFTRYNTISDEWFYATAPLPYNASITLFVYPNGTIDTVALHVSHNNDFPQDWNELAPNVLDPENFECKLTVLSGAAVNVGSSSTGVWINLSSTRSWNYYIETDPPPPPFVVDDIIGDWELQIREVGRPETVKTKLMRALVTVIGPPDGNPPP